MKTTVSKARIRITNLKLKAIVGLNDWERTTVQDIIVNILIEFDPSDAIASDALDTTVDYRAIKKRILKEIPSTSYKLLESLTHHILRITLENERVSLAIVKVDKPGALRFADSVSVEMEGHRATKGKQ